MPAWRLATAPLRPLPDILIVGTQRGGTTSMRTWLRNHPRVKVLEFGEVHYFDHNYDRGEHWYRSRFPMRFRPRRLVETSPYMLFHPLAPTRAGHDLPAGTRFVVLLREPAERALSHYRLERALGRESKSFADALEAEDERLAGTGGKGCATANGAARTSGSRTAPGASMPNRSRAGTTPSIPGA